MRCAPSFGANMFAPHQSAAVDIVPQRSREAFDRRLALIPFSSGLGSNRSGLEMFSVQGIRSTFAGFCDATLVSGH